MRRYNPKEIEPKWQEIWDKSQVYKADLHSNKPKYIAMSMFNYPSGSGIHIGHAMNYTISDVMARYKRQQGYESYHPVGWDSFGLPAENYAIKTGVSPQQSMTQIIPNYHKQYKAMGWSNDWSKEIATHEPEYYKWTQWLFCKMLEKGLAYQDKRLQWWCPIDNTVLANEQVTVDGKCWRHDAPTDPLAEKKEVKQWFFKITDFADDLLEGLDNLDWPESIKGMQRNWIGKSRGAEIDFAIEGSKDKVKIFTTRIDTIYGATFMVLAPEHPLVRKIATKSQKTSLEKYIAEVQRKTDVERFADEKAKSGIFTGSYAINPVNNEKLPIWIADFVMMGYGTGAIMAVPAHDVRDYNFANNFDLPIKQVIMPCEPDAHNPPKPDFEEVERPTVIVHLRDKSTGKYALLDWHESLEGITTAIMGGIENGQSPEEAAIREIKEEVALDGVKIVKKLRWITGAKYCASHKKQNRKAVAYGLLAEIDSLKDQGEIPKSEQKLHTLTWVSQNQVASKLTPQHQKLVWEQLCMESALTGEGELINSAKYDGKNSSEVRETLLAELAKRGLANEKTTYKLRDWSVSRQRYWGCPIPIIDCPKCGQVAVAEKDLPVLLPEITDYEPAGDGHSALARATDWLNVECPKCNGPAKRETDTMDTYVDSSWYMLRYFDPHNNQEIFDSKTVNKWMPIDFYNGADHATAHLIYARFITRFFHKLGLVSEPEPFKKFLFNGKVVAADGQMFSKSKGNGVDPLEIIDSGYGADALRMYLMFAAPLDIWARWDPHGVPGTYRFLTRLWNLTQGYIESNKTAVGPTGPLVVHRTIKKVTSDLESQKYNTAIAAMMAAVNELYKVKEKDAIARSDTWKFALESLIQLVAPFAPFIADELWSQLGYTESVHVSSWPAWDDELIKEELIKIAVQINGKVKSEILIETDLSDEKVIEAAKNDPKIVDILKAKNIKKSLYVKGRLVSITTD